MNVSRSLFAYAFAASLLYCVWPLAARAQGVAFFDDTTDVIVVDGQSLLGTASTYEAVVLFPSEVEQSGRLFNEWTVFLEDKLLQVGPNFIQTFNFPATSVFNVGVVMAHDVWHHVAFVYDGVEERVYVDGILLASRGVGIAIGNGSGLAHIGAIFRDNVLRNASIAYVESLRISDVARYEGPLFTPPLGDLEADDSTLLLLNFDEPAGSPTVQDEGPLGRTGTLGVGFEGATSPELAATPPTVGCPVAPDATDLWDVARGTSITSSTGFLSGDDDEGENVFGGDFPNPESGVAFFRDDREDGFVHAIEWETDGERTVRSVALRAAHDQGLLRRSFRTFRLYGYDDEMQTFQLLYEFAPPLPYGGGPEGNILTECANVPEWTAARFRAEFVQNGDGAFSGPRVVELDAFSTPFPVTVSAEDHSPAPLSLSLHAVHPNPARSVARFAYDLGVAGPTRVAIYDVLGREVEVLYDGQRGAGSYVVEFSAGHLPSGVYFVLLTAGAFSTGRAFTVVR